MDRDRARSDPLLTNIAQRNLRPKAGSPLVNAGNNAPPAPANFPYPSPLLLPAFDPPLRAKMAIGGQQARALAGGRIDIGALEDSAAASAPRPMNGAQPLLPPTQGIAAQDRDAMTLAAVPATPADKAPPAEQAKPPRRNFFASLWQDLQRWFGWLGANSATDASRGYSSSSAAVR